MLPDAQRWRELDRWLAELLALEPPARQARLDAIGRTDSALASELRGLLDSLAAAEPIERFGRSPLYAEALAALPGIGPGDRLGEWLLVERIGSGGMSEVFRAQREQAGVVQTAALKLMAVGMSAPAMRGRFLHECRCLAVLSDARIARYYDSGVAEHGRSWLAMEYVEGVPLDAFARAGGLDLRQRVGLLGEVAGAVAHAHGKLIVHGDLKPSNVLVTDAGQVKLLDFGIARLLDGSGERDAGSHPRMLTPEYASPEQLAGQPAGIGSDVYQLGLLLWMLVTGQQPWPAGSGAGRPAAAERPALRGLEAPSQVLRAAGRPRREVAAVRGDLDAIVARALQAQAGQRYASVDALARDLDAWRAQRPVQARPLGPLQRFGRVLHRHRLASALVAAAVVSGALAGAAWLDQTLRANREAHTAQAVHELLKSALFAGHYGAEPLPAESVSALLDEVEQQAPGRLAGQPEALAQTWLMVAEARSGRGQHQRAADVLERALGLPGLPPDLRARIELSLVDALHFSGRYSEAVGIAEAALARAQQRLGPEHPRLFPVLAELTDLAHSLGDYGAAQAHAGQLLAVARGDPGRHGTEVARAQRLLGMVLRDRGDFDAARAQLHSAVELDRLLLGDDHVNLAASLDHLGLLQLYRGEAEAAATLAEADRIRRRLFQPGLLGAVWSEHRLAQLASLRGERASATARLAEAVQVYARELGEASHLTALARSDLAWALLAQGDWTTARRELHHADAVLATLGQGRHPRRAEIQLGLAVVALGLGDAGQAAEHARRAHALVDPVLPPGHPQRVASCRMLRRLDLDCGDAETGTLREALAPARLALALARVEA
ncbi:MAG: protein kinase domain-containing protein [Lysobacteraceae bacterium]